MAAKESKVIAVANDDEWKEQVIDGSEEKLVVVDFWAQWCGPCLRFKPDFAELSIKFENVKFVSADVDSLQDVASEFEVSSIPNFRFIYKGKEVPDSAVVGANKAKLMEKIADVVTRVAE